MKKVILPLILLGFIVSSCTKEDTNGVNDTFNYDLLVNQKTDVQSVGVYKGTFATLDNSQRGSVKIEVNSNGMARAILKDAEGKDVILESKTNSFDLVSSLNLSFNNENISFDFEVSQDGNNPIVTNTIFANKSASMTILKETTRSPLLPITGTYTCDNCDLHPLLSSGVAQTFNATTVSGGGNNAQDIVTQIILDGRDYGSATGNTQSGCSNSGGVRTCNITGASATIDGLRAIIWTGIHQFSLGGTACSEVSGTWSFESQYGTLTGTFVGDAICGF